MRIAYDVEVFCEEDVAEGEVAVRDAVVVHVQHAGHYLPHEAARCTQHTPTSIMIMSLRHYELLLVLE